MGKKVCFTPGVAEKQAPGKDATMEHRTDAQMYTGWDGLTFPVFCPTTMYAVHLQEGKYDVEEFIESL